MVHKLISIGQGEQLDIFVHPSCVESASSHNEIFEQYSLRLWELFRQSSHKILLKGSHEGRYEDEISKEFRIQTYRRRLSATTSGLLGYSIDKELEHFFKILDAYSGYKIRIHGSFFGLCTQDCAQQVYFYVYEQVTWSLKTSFFNGRDLSRAQFDTLRRYEQLGTFLRSDIRYGLTLNSLVKGPGSIAPDEHYPFGCINFQFTDRMTEIF